MAGGHWLLVAFGEAEMLPADCSVFLEAIFTAGVYSTLKSLYIAMAPVTYLYVGLLKLQERIYS